MARLSTKIIIEISGDDEQEFAEHIVKMAVDSMTNGKFDVEPNFTAALTGRMKEFDELRTKITSEAEDSGIEVEGDMDNMRKKVMSEDAEWLDKNSSKQKKKGSSEKSDSVEDILKTLFE